MRKIVSYFVIALFFAILLVGCSNNQNEENQSETDSYNEVREVAWDFTKDKGWDDTAKGNWQSAEVRKVIVDNNYEFLDKTYEGKEALSVSFEDKENTVVGTPLVLIDIDTNKVIGYMPSE
ncbi:MULTISPECIES: hypothetical protein [Bacillaceae]|uniref:Uncharacterized protein n=1 Tax=Sutcliffiella horikoshii TaxID=79883 RepID=A0A5D4THJ1_9BACI|nr:MULTISPECIES: hypothetical protein [Bacillaceae]TYS74278.1 hypothetical protein FZC75_00805 [Sutcliffiella horikoshii]